MRNVLLVAYHFPPQAGSSGLLRALKYARYLPEFGWLPTVLTVHARAYDRLDPSQLVEIPAAASVVRAFAMDTQRHLAFRGRYPRWLALPDRWVSWVLGAIPSGLTVIRRRRIDVILTTYPIATAVLIGWILHRLTGKPWVVDFRDSMTEQGYPRDPLTRRIYRWIERRAVYQSSRLIFTARSAIQMYRNRYPGLAAEKCLLIPNGYDEEDFEQIILSPPRAGSSHGPMRLLHMGLLYPEERDPRPFFRALARLKREGHVDAARLRVDLRAAGSETFYSAVLRELELDDLVHLLPPLPYRQAIEDGATADGLLLFQAACCDHQIPAKAYEYLRLRKPILALTSATGDTAALLLDSGGATIVDLASEDVIYHALPQFLSSVQNGDHPLPEPQKVLQYSRRSQAEQLAHCLSALSD